VDSQGHLLGINTAIYSRSGGNLGIGFAIPVSTAKQVLEGIVRDGQVTRGWIGVEPNDLSPEISEAFGIAADRGVVISGVMQGGPAAQAGIVPGDVVLSIGGTPVDDVAHLLSTVAALKPGTPAKVSVQRKKTVLQLTLTPGVRPRPAKLPR
jgi:S1-C subfamily serine protease